MPLNIWAVLLTTMARGVPKFKRNDGKRGRTPDNRRHVERMWMNREDQVMNRRSLLWRLAGAAALTWSGERLGERSGLAREATSLESLGLPAVTITVTDAGYTVAPTSTPAGWTLLTLENQLAAGDTSADLMLVPLGESIEALLAGAADPTAPPPAWIYQTTFAGAPWVPAGATGQALVHLTAGDWSVFSPTPLAPGALTVTGDDAGTAEPAISADITLSMQDFAFLGLDDGVPTGPQVWKITNAGPQPHLMTFAPLPDGTTQEQFLAGMMTMMAGTPPPGGGDAEMPPVAGGCSTLSPNQSLYLALDLAPGAYGAVCFFPDQTSGAPHALMGMVQVFTAG